MAPRANSDRLVTTEGERINHHVEIGPNVGRFINGVELWINALPPGENKITVATLLVLFRRGDIHPSRFVQCIGRCIRHITRGYICSLVITDVTPDIEARMFRTHFVVHVRDGPSVRSMDTSSEEESSVATIESSIESLQDIGFR